MRQQLLGETASGPARPDGMSGIRGWNSVRPPREYMQQIQARNVGHAVPPCQWRKIVKALVAAIAVVTAVVVVVVAVVLVAALVVFFVSFFCETLGPRHWVSPFFHLPRL